MARRASCCHDSGVIGRALACSPRRASAAMRASRSRSMSPRMLAATRRVRFWMTSALVQVERAPQHEDANERGEPDDDGHRAADGPALLAAAEHGVGDDCAAHDDREQRIGAIASRQQQPAHRRRAAGPGAEQQQQRERDGRRGHERRDDRAQRPARGRVHRRQREAQRDQDQCRQHTHVVVAAGAERQPRQREYRPDGDQVRNGVRDEAKSAQHDRHRGEQPRKGAETQRPRDQRGAGEGERPGGVVLDALEPERDGGRRLARVPTRDDVDAERDDGEAGARRTARRSGDWCEKRRVALRMARRIANREVTRAMLPPYWPVEMRRGAGPPVAARSVIGRQVLQNATCRRSDLHVATLRSCASPRNASGGAAGTRIAGRTHRGRSGRRKRVLPCGHAIGSAPPISVR